MNTKPSLFSTDMVRALLDGRKTQTRRVVKEHKIDRLSTREEFATAGPYQLSKKETPGYVYVYLEDGPLVGLPCPYGQPGDLLWVRETCRAEELGDDDFHLLYDGEDSCPGLDGVRYKADVQFIPIHNSPEASDAWGRLHSYRGERGAVVPNIHMPRWASRLTLKIKDIRVERVRDISDDDAKAEGAKHWADIPLNPIHEKDPDQADRWSMGSPSHTGQCLSTPRWAFANYWITINKERGWEANPWVWVVEFEVIKANVDAAA